MQETQRCALLIKRHALSPFAAPAGLASTVQCCSLALLHCRALQASHNLALGPTLLRELWPACDQASTCFPASLLSGLQVIHGDAMPCVHHRLPGSCWGMQQLLCDSWSKKRSSICSTVIGTASYEL